MKINGIELKDIDLLDADVMEDVEIATENVVKDIEEVKKTESYSEAIRKQCIAIFEYFNTIFGEGTDKEIFGDKTNLRECLNAFKEFLAYIEEQMQAANKEFSITEIKGKRRK